MLNKAVRAMAGLGCQLGIATVAEGVETQDQLQDARRVEIDAVQGFVLAHPTSASGLTQLFTNTPMDGARAVGDGKPSPAA